MKNTTAAVLALACTFFVPAAFAADDGADLFKTKCSLCHGQAGNARSPAAEKLKLRDLASPDVQKLTDEELTQNVAAGGLAKKPSHAYATKGLSQEQIKSLTTYIRSLKP
ncbi:MAG: c-type cytochrome [Thermoanaerobaculia bacterium]|nr:c-type cytochrome [Thermoanaerobaculia bacterium]